MGEFVKGEVVVIPFPFSDLSASKRRPALVLANFEGNDILLCQITSQFHTKEKYVIPLNINDFASGTLPVNSYIRPTRIFTADKNIIVRTMGKISEEKLLQTINTIIEIMKQ